VLTVVLLVYFFLVYGETLARKTMALFSAPDHKRNTADILQATQSELSRYLFMTTLINACVGLGAGLIAHFSHVEDALLWGVLAAVLNFVPYVGPACMVFVFLVLGLLDFDRVGQALVPAGFFLALVILEGQFLTPLILGRNLRLNPVIIILWLMLLGWMWGPVGAVVAVPALAVVKIVCARVAGWEWMAKAIE
jgi:predicted PurR-regulated permease PerM